MYEDREKNLWVATRHNGMYRFNPSLQYFLNIAHQHPLNDKQGEGSIMSFIETKNSDLLTGAWGDGLYRYNRKLKNIPAGIKDPSLNKYPSIWSMCASADSNIIWMSCQPGLYLYDQAKNIMHFRNPPVLQNRTMRQVAEDKQGNLWLGMHGTGVYRWIQPKNLKKDSIIRVEEAGNSMVNKIVVDSKGKVWIATGGHGLFLFDGNTGKQIRRWSSKGKGADTLLGDAITGVSEYNDSLVFITTVSEMFFYHRNSQQITEISLAESLMGSIASHQKDNMGYIWISTTNALYRYYPVTKSMVMFDRSDGINNDRFVLNASYKMKDGRLVFGNDNAFIIFDPAAIKLSGRHIPIVFTSLEIGKREIRIDSVLKLDRLELGPDDNSVTVEFSTLTFASHPVVQYKLDGVDDNWYTADKGNRATFPFLPSGKCIIRLRTINADGIPSPNHTTLAIFIRSPFWQTWWFYTLLGLLVAFVLFWFDRQRSQRKEALQKVRTDIADGLHQEVNTALSNINILSEIARLKSEKEPQKAKDYLEQIHTKSHNMIIALDDMLWSLNPANDAMDKTIQRVKEFADALTQRHGVVIELLIDKKVEKLELDMKLRHEAFLLFKEGLRSLVTAGTKLCVVHLTAERAKLLFTIEFENEGCDIQQLNNLLHRRDMEARLQALKAKLNVQVHKSRSVFMIQLPLT
jgi:streptogramin lyase